MPDNTPASASTPNTLSDLITKAISEISPETQQAIAGHPNTSGVVAKIQAALGMRSKQDVMSTPEQVAAKDAGVATMAHPDGSDSEAAARNAVITQMQQAKVPSETTRAPVSADGDSFAGMLKGVGQLITDQLLHGYNQASKNISNSGSSTSVSNSNKEPK
jgi:fructose 1,6-bisphosphatase